MYWMQKNAIFNGVPAFVSTLIGSVELSRTFQSEEKVLVLRFKHPEWDSEYRYSYGILIPSFGSTGITDYSGWLVFFDCATDFSGFGGSLHQDAETFIGRYLERGEIEVKEEVADIEMFKRYLAEKNVSSIFDQIKYVVPPEELTEELTEPSVQRLKTVGISC